jgi:hypothetical protein
MPSRLPVVGGEHIAGVLPRLPGRGPFVLLAPPVRSQHGHGRPVQRHGSAAGRGLRWPDRHRCAVGQPLLVDRQRPLVEVQIAPAQTRCLASAQPAQRDEPPHRVQPVRGHEVEELDELVFGPYRYRRALAPCLDPCLGPDLCRWPARRRQLHVHGRGCPAAAHRGSRRSVLPAAWPGSDAATPASTAARAAPAPPTAQRTSLPRPRPVSSASRIRPMYGIRCRWTRSV